MELDVSTHKDKKGVEKGLSLLPPSPSSPSTIEVAAGIVVPESVVSAFGGISLDVSSSASKARLVETIAFASMVAAIVWSAAHTS